MKLSKVLSKKLNQLAFVTQLTVVALATRKKIHFLALQAVGAVREAGIVEDELVKRLLYAHDVAGFQSSRRYQMSTKALRLAQLDGVDDEWKFVVRRVREFEECPGILVWIGLQELKLIAALLLPFDERLNAILWIAAVNRQLDVLEADFEFLQLHVDGRAVGKHQRELHRTGHRPTKALVVAHQSLDEPSRFVVPIASHAPRISLRIVLLQVHRRNGKIIFTLSAADD